MASSKETRSPSKREDTPCCLTELKLAPCGGHMVLEMQIADTRTVLEPYIAYCQTTYSGIVKILIQFCKCLDLIDIDSYQPKLDSKIEPEKFEEFKPDHLELKPIRKYWLLNEHPQFTKGPAMPRVSEDEKDTSLKQKIANLVDQTMRDTQKKMKKTEEIKRDNRDAPPYKVGFILCMIKKSKNVMDELFNVAVKHRDQWKSLQHLKVFELIVHTNVDTTNLLRQLVDVHLKFMNSTRSEKRLILL